MMGIKIEKSCEGQVQVEVVTISPDGRPAEPEEERAVAAMMEGLRKRCSKENFVTVPEQSGKGIIIPNNTSMRLPLGKV